MQTSMLPSLLSMLRQRRQMSVSLTNERYMGYISRTGPRAPALSIAVIDAGNRAVTSAICGPNDFPVCDHCNCRPNY